MTGELWVAGACAAATGLLLHRRPARPRRRGRTSPGRAVAVAPLVLPVAAVAVAWPALGALPSCIAAAGGLGVSRLARRARRRRAAADRRQRVVDYAEALLGELQAGRPPDRACARAAQVWPEAEVVATAARLDADVPAALRRLACLPGAEQLDRLGSAWALCAGSGAGLGVALEQVVATARREQVVMRLLQTELAAARATGRLVTALPVVVLTAAHGIGAQPLQFLLHTLVGNLCLGAGTGLLMGGLWWIERLGDPERASAR